MIAGRTTQGDCKVMAVIGLTRDAEERMHLEEHVEKMTDAKHIDTRLLDCILLGMVEDGLKFDEKAFMEIEDPEKYREKSQGDSK